MNPLAEPPPTPQADPDQPARPGHDGTGHGGTGSGGSRRGRFRLWLIMASGAWAALLLAATYNSFHTDEPTVREQRTIAQAAPVVDGVMGELIKAAQPEAVAVLSPPVLTEGCRITSARDGAELRREITVHTSAGDGPGLLGRLRDRLPAAYDTRIRIGADDEPDALSADAGEFVGVHGAVTSPGVIRLIVDTGCRPRSPGVTVDAGTLARRPVHDVPERVLTALGVPAGASSDSTAARCPAGGVAVTASAQGRPERMPVRLSAELPSAVSILVDEPDRYVYREGATGVVVERMDDRVRVSATVAC